MTPDPICRRIERSRALWDAYSEICNSPEPPLRTPEYDRYEAEQERRLNSWASAFEAMVSTAPRTTAGAVKLIDTFLASEAEVLSREHDQVLALLHSLRRLLRKL